VIQVACKNVLREFGLKIVDFCFKGTLFSLEPE
jgi:hypothetical protein